MTASDLRDLIVRDIVRAHGGSVARWRKAVGLLKVYPVATHAHCNWEARPSGSAHEIAIVERGADEVRTRFPFVEED